MNLFTYLMSKKGKNYLPHKNDLFAYLLGKSKFVPQPIDPKTATGTTINIRALKSNVDELKMTKESSQNGTPTPNNPIEINIVKTSVTLIITNGTNTKTVTIPLGDNEVCGIGDYLDELIIDNNGHCWLNKKIGKKTFNGTETWKRTAVSGSSTYAFWNTYTNFDIPTGKYGTKLCNYFEYQNETWEHSTPNHLAENGNSASSLSILFNVDNTIATTLDQWYTWLSTHNTTVYYQLETPELIDLNYTVDLSLYIGQNTITNDKDATMYLIYY